MTDEMEMRRELLTALVEAGKFIPRKYLSLEGDLMVTKWPAYRFLNPRRATAIFADDYITAYKNCVRAEIDKNRAETIQPLIKSDFNSNNSGYTNIWMARQHADELGMPYPRYLEFCFHFYLRRQRKQLPQPNQLRPNRDRNPDMAKAFYAELEKFWDDDRKKIEFANLTPMPQYCTDYYAELPAQKIFQDQLLQGFRLNPGNLNIFIGIRVLGLRQLTEDSCSALAPPDIFERTLDIAKSEMHSGSYTAESYVSPSQSELFQACFGVPGIEADKALVCEACPQRAPCQKLRELVARQLKAETGSADPLRLKALEKQRHYTQKSRDKTKALALTGVP
ncbi:hypothetical protein [Pseudogemmobacter sp. W21_MBD1_M6]|uniref:hypothetical protein n=1 Tax=Pseudogemmobacter sp. W21_MBD1_M6 TaxID=3240271 RepID=UPI003F9B05F0